MFPKMTHNVLTGTLNDTHTLTHSHSGCSSNFVRVVNELTAVSLVLTHPAITYKT